MTAKKDNKARRLAKKRKRQRRPPASGQQALLKRVRNSERFKDATVMVNPAGTEKMSEVILHFAAPLQDESGVVPRAAIELAILMWNASFMPKEMQTKAINDVVRVMPREDREARRELRSIANELLARKKTHFSTHQRMIVDYQLTESAHRINLDVVSTMVKGNASDRQAER